MKKMLLIIGVIILIITIKLFWVRIATRNHGSFDAEKHEILQRRNYLADRLITTPSELLVRMPRAIGKQFQGEWALYSCSMFTAALVNIARLYPEEREESIRLINEIIQIALSPEIRRYDAVRWGEDPLESLSGERSHISYLSHLAWMIGGYRAIGGGPQYDDLHDELCAAMNRRILQSLSLNLPTYPGEFIYVPDMLVAIVALSDYSRQHSGKYATTVDRWEMRMREEYLDPTTGLIPSFLSSVSTEDALPVKGSYTALSCYYLTLVDPLMAREQYDRMKKHFLKGRPITGIKEYAEKSPFLSFDIDAGPIICGLSPTGTAFASGSATFFQDTALRCSILKTAEQAGTTVTIADKTHYALADIALVGEAIMLAMRTNLQSASNTIGYKQ